MNDELMQALQAGQITLAQYKQAVQDFVMNSTDISGDMKNALGRRGLDTPQERDFLMQQGLLGGQQMGQSPVQMPQEHTFEDSPELINNMEKQGYIQNIMQRGAPTQNENDFLGQFVNNAKNAMGGRPNVDTPQQRDYLQNIMQNYNKGHNYSR